MLFQRNRIRAGLWMMGGGGGGGGGGKGGGRENEWTCYGKKNDDDSKRVWPGEGAEREQCQLLIPVFARCILPRQVGIKMGDGVGGGVRGGGFCS